MAEKTSSKQSSKVMNILAGETGGKSYKAHKYSLNNVARSSIDYDEEKTIQWKEKAETETYREHIGMIKINVKNMARSIKVLPKKMVE
jgi:hypothetical protein